MSPVVLVAWPSASSAYWLHDDFGVASDIGLHQHTPTIVAPAGGYGDAPRRQAEFTVRAAGHVTGAGAVRVAAYTGGVTSGADTLLEAVVEVPDPIVDATFFMFSRMSPAATDWSDISNQGDIPEGYGVRFTPFTSQIQLARFASTVHHISLDAISPAIAAGGTYTIGFRIEGEQVQSLVNGNIIQTVNSEATQFTSAGLVGFGFSSAGGMKLHEFRVTVL